MEKMSSLGDTGAGLRVEPAPRERSLGLPEKQTQTAGEDGVPVDYGPFELPVRSIAQRLRRASAMLVVIASAPLVAISIPDDLAPIETTIQATASDSQAFAADEPAGVGLDLQASGTRENLSASANRLDLANAEAIQTVPTTEPTTTTTIWVEPDVEPESEWIDAGHGVRVPDLLLRIRFCESTNYYQSTHVASSASGAYQFLTKSWGWYGHAERYGVASGAEATPAQQDEAALLTWRQDGARPWAESRRCWDNPGIPGNYATAVPRTTTTTSTAPPEETTSTSAAGETTTTAEGETTSTGSSASTTSPETTTTTTASTSSSSDSTSSTTVAG